MKTVIDLIQKVKTLQASFTDVCRDLTEWEASQQQPVEVSIEDFMHKGSCFPIQGHALSQVQEPLVQEAYLTLLLVVAEKMRACNSRNIPCFIPVASQPHCLRIRIWNCILKRLFCWIPTVYTNTCTWIPFVLINWKMSFD